MQTIQHPGQEGQIAGASCGQSARKSADFEHHSWTQDQSQSRVNLLWCHGTIVNAYKTREICSALGTPFSATSI
ncbi:MAG TPA: hypothetical protein VLM40_01155, partial [Gemmata sp.]|nr:hypothetical protein [Gemmata sp.]